MRAFLSLVVVAVLTRASAVPAAEAVEAERLGSVQFAVSCNAAAQVRFQRAVALLHSFWYEELPRAFGEVLAADPGCAMAHWGLAMGSWHPLWAPPTPQELQEGSAALQRALSLPIGATTERERGFIMAIAAFYDGDKVPIRQRALAYEKAMEAVHSQFPKDDEAAAFYALSLLATAPLTDRTYANQKKALSLMEPLFARRPDHPGAAHYVIHACDNPAMASRALGAARAYAKVAPAVPHALHMPSHIFTRLGLWEESIASNRAAVQAASDYAARVRMRGVWDEQLHAMEYLTYAYLQTGRDASAKAVVAELGAMERVQGEGVKMGYPFVASPGRYVLERRDWAAAAGLTPLRLPPVAWLAGFTAYARGYGSARLADAAATRRELERIQWAQQAVAVAGTGYWASQLDVMARTVDAWLAHAERRDDEALRLMQSAADLEDAMDKLPVTPGPLLPAREVLGDLLLDLGQPGPALVQYEASLRESPDRFNSLCGGARAARLAGDEAKAQRYVTRLLEVGAHADGDRPELAEAKALLAATR